jgi:hypothetical protein
MPISIASNNIYRADDDFISIFTVLGWYEDVTGTKFVLPDGFWYADEKMDKSTKTTLSMYLDNPLTNFADVINRKMVGGVQLIDNTLSKITALDRISNVIPRIGEYHLHLSNGSYPIGLLKSIDKIPFGWKINFEEGCLFSDIALLSVEITESLVERLKKLMDVVSFVKSGKQMNSKDKDQLRRFYYANIDRLTEFTQPIPAPQQEGVELTKSYENQLFISKTKSDSLFETLVEHIKEKVGDIKRCHFLLFKSQHSWHNGNLLWVSVDGMHQADLNRLIDGVGGFESVAYQYEPHISPLMVKNKVPIQPFSAKVFIQGEADGDFDSLADRLSNQLGSSCRFLLFRPQKIPNQIVGKILYVVVEGVKQQRLIDVAKIEMGDDFSIVDSSLDNVPIVEFKYNDLGLKTQ